MIGHCEFCSSRESLVSSVSESPSSDSGACAGSGTDCFFKSFLPVILSTMPEMVMDGLMSAAEPVYPRSLSSSET